MESHRRRGPFFTDRGQRKDLCFRATGRRRSTALPRRDHWKRELEIEPTNRLHNEPAAAGHGKGPKSTPVISNGNVCTLGISGVLSCHDARTGKLKWRREFST